MLLVRHAAAQADDEVMLFFLESLQGTYVAEHTLLGMLTHGAGVEEDQVGVLRLHGPQADGAAFDVHYSPMILLRISIATPQALAFSVIFDTRNLVSL